MTAFLQVVTPVMGLCKGYDQISPNHSETRSSLKMGEICLPKDASCNCGNTNFFEFSSASIAGPVERHKHP